MIDLPLTHALLQEGIDAGLHPGAQIYVSLRGAVVADDGIGESRPGVTMDRDTINIWMSSTKPITAMLFARLWEKDRVPLDSVVADIVPEFAAGGKEAVTFRHLLTHTGGFREEPIGLAESDWETAVGIVCEIDLEEGWVPGDRAGYHPATSWYILAEAVSRVEEKPYPDLLRECVFDPLGMTDSWIGIPRDRFADYGDRIGWMHVTRRDVEPHPSLNDVEAAARIHPGGNGRGPVRDLGRFYESLLDDTGVLVSPDTVEHFVSRHREGTFDHTLQHYVDWGLGFMVDSNRYGPETVPYGFGLHASPDTFGHGGAQSSAAFADPRHGLVVALVCIGMPGEPRHQKRARDLHTAIYEDLGLGG